MIKQGSHIPGKVREFDLGPGKLLEFQNSAICPGIVPNMTSVVCLQVMNQSMSENIYL